MVPPNASVAIGSAAGATVNGTGASRFFVVRGELALSNLTLVDGYNGSYGGGVAVGGAGTLVLRNVSMSGCVSAFGGAVYALEKGSNRHLDVARGQLESRDAVAKQRGDDQRGFALGVRGKQIETSRGTAAIVAKDIIKASWTYGPRADGHAASPRELDDRLEPAKIERDRNHIGGVVGTEAAQRLESLKSGAGERVLTVGEARPDVALDQRDEPRDPIGVPDREAAEFIVMREAREHPRGILFLSGVPALDSRRNPI